MQSQQPEFVPNVVQASLYGGPLGKRGARITLRGVQPERWPESICIGFRNPNRLEQHYRHIAARVYEYVGPCAEFPHSARKTGPRCPDCGASVDGPPVDMDGHVHVIE